MPDDALLAIVEAEGQLFHATVPPIYHAACLFQSRREQLQHDASRISAPAVTSSMPLQRAEQATPRQREHKAAEMTLALFEEIAGMSRLRLPPRSRVALLLDLRYY